MSEPKPQDERDRVIADSGWGIKPDDQPANAAQAAAGAAGGAAGRAGGNDRYDRADPQAVRKLLRAQRQGFNTANRVRVESGRTSIFDINGDAFVIEGLGFGDENVIELLQCLGASFNPQELRRMAADAPTPREFRLSRVWAWGAERTG